MSASEVSGDESRTTGWGAVVRELLVMLDARDEALREAHHELQRIVSSEDLPWCHAKADALRAKLESVLSPGGAAR